MEIKTNLANKENYGSMRSVADIRYIVIHYTANDGDTDENNGTYFHNNVVGASAHYFVDDDSVTQTVPDNYIAWHCGTRNTYRHAFCRNTNSIGIEICDDIKNGVIYPSVKTITNALELTEQLMKKYSIPKENVVRHYDVTGKACPVYWVDDSKWKSEFWNKIGEYVKPELTSANDIIWELKNGSLKVEINEVDKAVLELQQAQARNSSLYWILRKIVNK